MKNLHVAILLIVLGILVTTFGGIMGVFSVVGASYLDDTVAPYSQESFIIHLGLELAVFLWQVTLVIIIGFLIGMAAWEIHKRYMFSLIKREDVDER
jgi:hypothetical protein